MRRTGRPQPDIGNYHDTGCEVSPSCLKCPLPVCKYEGGFTQQRIVDVTLAIVRGATYKQAARRFGVSDSQARRDFMKAKEVLSA